MNGCEECIVYCIHHNLNETEECPVCGKKSLVWKQGDFGTPHLECLECEYIIAVDLNTPCEMDPVFRKKITIFINPQSELPDKNELIILAKDFGMNTLQMYKSLKAGFSLDMTPDKLDKVILSLKSMGVGYRVDGFENLREKYPFYRECGYPYSAMHICKVNDNT